MAYGGRPRLGRCRAALAMLATILIWSWSGSAHAERSTFRTYGTDQGLASLDGFCLVRDRAGELLVCSGHGVFTYDGRRFVNLGSEHKLPEGGIVYNIAVTPSGRIAIQYSTEIYVSDRSTGAGQPATSLSFSALDHPGSDFFDQRQHRSASWRDGFVFLLKDETVGVTVPAKGRAHLGSLGYDARDHALLRDASGIFSAKGGRYKGYSNALGLFTTPDGRIITQSAQGLAVRGSQGWREMTVADGAPDGTIVAALTDETGELWFHMLGRGLMRWVGYGHWSTVEKSDGLSAGFPWQTARSPNGHLWATTDGGVDELVPQDGSIRVARTFPFGSYAMAATPAGEIWAGNENNGVQVIDPRTGSTSPIAMPAGAETIVPGADQVVWLGTSKGLYRVNDAGGPPFKPELLERLDAPVQSIVRDGGDGIYYLSGGWLHHWHQNETDATVTSAGWNRSDESMGLAISRDGSLWVSGPRGLRHVVLSGDHIRSNQAIPIEDIRSTTVPAVMVDHRGWVWVGTSAGISVFDGTRWVSADADQGLLSNDINEDGIREDPDGSIWIATTSGLSHLQDPASLFVTRPLSVMITGAHIGADTLDAATLPYSRQPLSIDLGTPNYAVERSVLFRHRLSGVDGDWVTSAAGTISYPSVPPGRHQFTVVGYDPLSHRASAPVTLVVRIAFPWWRSWWSEALWIALGGAVFYGGLRIRDRAMYARQAELKQHVARATAQLQHQAIQLRHVAAHDRLTGLLTRAEVETRLAGTLTNGSSGELVVAMLDVDHFKRINDENGHLGGDEVLRALGRMISRVLHGAEYAGRYGGEEILMALSDADGAAAERVLKLHLAIKHDTFATPRGPISITCSIGVAWAGAGDTWESLIGRADAALYQAKHGGRDRVVESECRPDPARFASA